MYSTKLDKPLDFHIEWLAKEYGHIEILQSQIDLLPASQEYLEVVGNLEKAREGLGNIIRNQKSQTIALRGKDCESSNDKPQTGESL